MSAVTDAVWHSFRNIDFELVGLRGQVRNLSANLKEAEAQVAFKQGKHEELAAALRAMGEIVPSHESAV